MMIMKKGSECGGFTESEFNCESLALSQASRRPSNITDAVVITTTNGFVREESNTTVAYWNEEYRSQIWWGKLKILCQQQGKAF